MKSKYVFNKEKGVLERVQEPTKTPEIKPQVAFNNDGGELNIIKEKAAPTVNYDVKQNTICFREKTDLTIFQIIDEKTGKVLAYISGYGLDINFNMNELKSVESVEQMLTGISKMFRNIVLEKIFNKEK